MDRFRPVCLALSSEDKTKQDDDENDNALVLLFSSVFKSLENVVEIIGKNCSFNPSIAKKNKIFASWVR